MIGVKPAGMGLDTQDYAVSLCNGTIGIIHGFKCYTLQNEKGELLPVYSAAVGLDYLGMGPEHSYHKEIGRVQYIAATGSEAFDAFYELSTTEG